MKFSIITPTYKRADKLTRAIDSVVNQTHNDWEIIIVNDSPDDVSYSNFEKNIKDRRIKYFKNEKNMGVNYSRNFTLDNLSNNSDFIIFLDDDDWFANDTLSNFEKLIKENPKENWIATNRAYENGQLLTLSYKKNNHYDYVFDYLIFRRFKGDATHCVKIKEVKNIRFSKKVKQGEEWFFFYQLGLRNKFFYSYHNSTLSDGYNKETGLNFRKQNRNEQLETLVRIINESFILHIFHYPSFLIYLFIRLIRIFIKS